MHWRGAGGGGRSLPVSHVKKIISCKNVGTFMYGAPNQNFWPCQCPNDRPASGITDDTLLHRQPYVACAATCHVCYSCCTENTIKLKNLKKSPDTIKIDSCHLGFICTAKVQKCNCLIFKMAAIFQSQGHLTSYSRTRCPLPQAMSLASFVLITKNV